MLKLEFYFKYSNENALKLDLLSFFKIYIYTLLRAFVAIFLTKGRCDFLVVGRDNGKIKNFERHCTLNDISKARTWEMSFIIHAFLIGLTKDGERFIAGAGVGFLPISILPILLYLERRLPNLLSNMKFARLYVLTSLDIQKRTFNIKRRTS